MANSRNAYRSFVGDIYFKNITFSDKLFHTSYVYNYRQGYEPDRHTIGGRVGGITES